MQEDYMILMELKEMRLMLFYMKSICKVIRVDYY